MQVQAPNAPAAHAEHGGGQRLATGRCLLEVGPGTWRGTVVHINLHDLQLSRHLWQHAAGQQHPGEGLAVHELRPPDARNASCSVADVERLRPFRGGVHQPPQLPAIPHEKPLAMAHAAGFAAIGGLVVVGQRPPPLLGGQHVGNPEHDV